MVECPICNVKNEEGARFCAECGQRLTQNQASYEVSSDLDTNLSLAQFETLPTPSTPHAAPTPGLKLNSPLLNQPALNQPEKAPPGKYENIPRPKGKGLRSPLLNAEEFDELEQAEAYELQQNTMLESGTSQKQGTFRSPLLNGKSQGPQEPIYEEEANYDPFADEDNPNILRSPLLAAKITLEESEAAKNKVISQAPLPQKESSPISPSLPQSSQAQPVLPNFIAEAWGQPEIGKPPNPNSQRAEAWKEQSEQVNPQALSISQTKGVKPGQGNIPPTPTSYSAIPLVLDANPESALPRRDQESLREGPLTPVTHQPFRTRSVFKPTNEAIEPSTSEPSPIIKIIGIVLIFILLLKLWALIGYMSTDWFKFTPFIIDQLVLLILLASFIILCFVSKK